ncbi:hypothetical protein Pelo_8283 [Pelomyxa schiedti]|nr:hypothetical protein Pelo_8283 [Pelomyxa schiedti]
MRAYYDNNAPLVSLTRSVATLDARQQLLAFASASHPRCGATSAARSLWLHGQSAAAAVRDACCVRGGGASARCDCGCGGWAQRFCLVEKTKSAVLVTFGISPVLLGVTHEPAVVKWGNTLTHRLVGCDRALTCCEEAGRALVLCDRGAHGWDYGTAKVVMTRAEWESPGERWRITNNERWMMAWIEGKIVVFDLWCDEPRKSRVTVSYTCSKREPHFIWSKYILDEVVLIVPDAEAEGSKKFVAVDVLRTSAEKRLCVMSVTSVPIGNVWSDMYGESLHMKGEEGVECVVVDNAFYHADPGIVHVALPGGKLMYLTRGTCGLSQLNRHQFCIQSYPQGQPPLFEVWDCRNVTSPLSSIETPEVTVMLGGGILWVPRSHSLPQCFTNDFQLILLVKVIPRVEYLRMEPPSLSQLNRHQFCIQSFPRGRPPLFEVWDCNNVTAPLSSIETPEDFSVFGGSGFLFSTTKGTLTVTDASSGFLVLTLSFSVQHVMINQARSYL